MNNVLKTLIMGAVCGSLLVVACEKKQNDSKEVAEETNEAKFDGKQEDYAELMVNIAKSNISEIKLSKLASEVAKDEKVKDFAKMMVMDHTKMGVEAKALAAKKGYTLPDTIGVNDIDGYKDLQGKSAGVDFDKTYSDRMVDDHQKLLDKLNANKDVTDPDVKEFILKAIPAVQSHLDMAKMCQEKMSHK